MASILYKKDISSGIAEYHGKTSDLAIGESITFEFTDEVTVDEIVFQLENTDGSSRYDVNINYPNSGTTATINGGEYIEVGTNGNWFLNQTNAGKKWYRLPAWSTIDVTRLEGGGTTTNPTITLMVLGRSSN